MRIAGVVLLLAACVSTHKAWRNPAGNGTFKTDWYECERDARVTGVVGKGIFSRKFVEVDEDFRKQCLEARGWESFDQSDEPEPEALPFDAGSAVPNAPL